MLVRSPSRVETTATGGAEDAQGAPPSLPTMAEPAEGAATAKVVLDRRAAKGAKNAVRKILRMVRLAASTLVGLAVVLVIVGGLLVRQSPAGYSTILGHPLLRVLSGSMTPTFRTGDLVIDQPISAQAATSLHVGEIVTFDEPGSNGALLVTHRIYQVIPAAHGPGGLRTVSYVTKGDANNTPDSWRVVPSEVLARYEFRLPDGGYVLSVLRSRWSLVAGIVFLLAWALAGWRLERRRREMGARLEP